LADHHRSGSKHSAETIERIRATRLAQIAREREAAQVEEEILRAAVVVHPDVELYRETRAARLPVIEARQNAALAAAKKTCDEADARLHELRHRGRPKNKPRLLLHVGRENPDALIAAVTDWHGER
jgi:hypothetical protein